MVKRLVGVFIGSAAGLVVTAAQAADLPVKAAPVQYVKICSLYGAGFYYVPGTDTCLKIGGYVRAEYNINARGSFGPIINGTQALHNRNSNEINSRVRGIISFDARTQTEYGTLRSYIEGGWQSDNGATPSTATAPYRFFVQLAGFTAGVTQSFFDFYLPGRYSNLTRFLGSYSGGAGITSFAYTTSFGNGLSATLSIEEANARRTQVINVDNTTFNRTSGSPSNTGFSNAYAASQWPDVVGNLRVDEAWGSAQVMGALHQVNGSYFGATEITGHPDDKVGFAVGGGFTVNLPMFGKGDTFSMQAAYANGATRYNGFGLATVETYDGDTVGLGLVSDAVYAANSALQLTRSWSVEAGAEHHWNKNWRTSLYANYLNVDYDTNATAFLDDFFGLPAGSNPDFTLLQIGSRTVWSPVQNLNLSVDILYNKLETGYDGAALPLNPGGGKPNAVYGVTDQDWWQGIFRVQRNFYP